MTSKSTDERGMAIPKYKLSDDQIEFSKKFKKLKQLRELLGAESARLSAEMQRITGMLGMLDQSAQQLKVPTNVLKGMPQQNFMEASEAEKFLWRYVMNAYEQLDFVRDIIGESVAAHWSSLGLLRRLNLAQKKLAAELAMTPGDWFVKNSTVTLSDGAFNLPADCSKPLYRRRWVLLLTGLVEE